MDWFTADMHFDHEAVIGMDGRPFKSQDEMHETLIRNWNACVQPGDRCWILGDFCLGKDPMQYLNRMKGDIHLVWGNHDHFSQLKAKRFSSFHDIQSVMIEEQKIVMCHYPMLSWHGRGKGVWQLYGHVHNEAFQPVDRLALNVGVMHHNYSPVNFQCIKTLMQPKIRAREAYLAQTAFEQGLN